MGLEAAREVDVDGTSGRTNRRIPSWAKLTIDSDQMELTKDLKAGQPTARAELLDVFDDSVRQGRAAVEGSQEEQLERMCSMTKHGQKMLELPKTTILRTLVLNQLIHHRGQLSVYLRLLDAPVPGMYGPSADGV